MSSTSTLRIADVGDIDPVANLVARSFERLGVIEWLVPDPDWRLQVTRDWYRLYIAHAIGGPGQVVVNEVDGACVAAAVWFDRTGPATEPDDYDKHLADLAGQYLPQFQRLGQRMDANHPVDPHWYLLFLAVDRTHWGHGHGGELMDYTHAQLDELGIAAYLEATGKDSTGKDNVPLYERHGYKLMDPPTVDVDVDPDIDLYRMWRSVPNG